jgi:hypothetical protein
VVTVLLLAAFAVSALGDGDDAPPERSASPTTTPPDEEADLTTTAPEATTTTAPTTTSTTSPTTTTAAPVLPAGWAPFQDPQGAYALGLPSGWQVRPTSEPRRIDLVDPTTGSFLRVEWTDQPKPDPEADWRDQASAFEARNANYEEIGIGPATYRDYDAALWEFRHGSGETLHTGNLGFVTDGKGFALMFRTPESQWAALQPVYEQFKQAFQPT